MQNSFRKIMAITILSSVLSACMNPDSPNNTKQNLQQDNSNKAASKNADDNVVEYVVPNDQTPETNYKKAAELNAELAIIYSTEGYLARAKEKLIKAQKLSKEHDYSLAIVDYAAGYYYQTIGANSIAAKYYEDGVYYHPDSFEAMNFYAQYLCKEKRDYKKAQELFNKSMYTSNNDDMAQTLFLYSQCMYNQGKKVDALALMKKADKFRINYRAAKLRLAEMYFEQNDYKECYKVIYSMKDDGEFFNNKRVLDLRLKLANYAHNKNEAAEVELILSSNNYNDKDMDEFFSKTDQGGMNKNA